MSSLIIDNIGELVTNDPTLGESELGIVRNASIVFEDGRVSWVGLTSKAPCADQRVDAGNRSVIPGFVDSHSHLAFCGDRADEFVARMQGSSYRAGGIRTTVSATRGASDEELSANVARLASEALRSGTTTIEIKSGYGLNVEDEERSLKIASLYSEETTYLGAHVVPDEYSGREDAYVDLVCNEMLFACAPHARWVDVFCERGAFDVDQARAVLAAGMSEGLRPRVHAGQLGVGPGVQLAVELEAASVDHCTYLSKDDIDALASSSTVATLLPGVEFSTRSPYPDARQLTQAGVTIALASDCNPGSSYTSNMAFCISLAVREMNMSPDQALWSSTAGGALALQRTDIGRLSLGARADAVLLAAPSHTHLSYRPGMGLIEAVWKDGKLRL